MPYALIATVVVLAIAGRFVIASNASRRAKAFVALVCLASIALPYVVPQWQLGCLLIQVLLVIALVMHAKAGAT